MYRKISRTLEEWKAESARKPLLIKGARQVGKTYVIKGFGGTAFDTMLFIDFEKMPKAKVVFEDDLSPEKIIPQLEALTGVRFINGRSLIVLDEIQACPRAITALKYFYDSGQDIHVIGAGSLLGVALRRDEFSFPVGKVKTLNLFPLDFEEFLYALGKDDFADLCRNAFLSASPLPSAIHEEMLSLYRTYLVTGGMPEVVSSYVEHGSFLEVHAIQAEILSNYHSDIAKYADENEKVLAQRAFDTIPIQLAKENHKFQYNLIRKGATAGLFGPALEWLSAAGLTLRCGKLSKPELPIKAYEDLSSFKLYLLDPGLLVQMSGLPGEVVLSQLGGPFTGGLTENYVASMLVANGFPLFYWESSGKAEIDFIIQIGTKVVPIEVKASSHVRSRSLSVYRDAFKPSLALRISSHNFGLENGLFAIPLYATWLIDSGNLSKVFA